ncbi:MAG: penicillin binding protein transpeptidase domain-containing protein, partial [Bdellovibrionales bacterium]|nr:penicillin binding protein transpeptidase domain-containing protein [Bdellovibrionales bacterium]
MKILISLFTTLLFLSSCATQPPKKFANKDVCFLLFNLGSGTFEKIINQDRCGQKLPAASTFKVPLAVMAFDSGVLKDEHTMLKWDGEKRFLDAWNKDHTASSWMKDSVVWFSQ